MPMRFREATAIIGPIIHGIGVWSWLNTNPAGMPIAKALRIPGIWLCKCLNSFMCSRSLRAAKIVGSGPAAIQSSFYSFKLEGIRTFRDCRCATPMRRVGINRCGAQTDVQDRRLGADLILRSTRQSRAPEVWLEWPVFAVAMDRYVGSGHDLRQTRKLQASKPSAAIPDMAASGLLINCHARISGTDFLMLSNGISLSMPQRAIM